MNQMFDNSSAFGGEIPVHELAEDVRARFLARTYGHLFGAILGFVALEVAFFQTGFPEKLITNVPWFALLGGFMVVSWLASRVAHTAKTLGMQYAALAAYVLVQAVIFAPLLYIADISAPGVIANAAAVTLTMFAGLTAIVFVTRKDFSFLRTALMFGGIAALVAIGGQIFFGFELGGWFTIGMIAFACMAILYDTSNVLHHFPEDRYVGASLELFASVALLFWYILQFFMSQDD